MLHIPWQLPLANTEAEGSLQQDLPAGAQTREELHAKPGGSSVQVGQKISGNPVPRSWSKFALDSQWHIPLSLLIPHHMGRAGSSKPKTPKQKPFKWA